MPKKVKYNKYPQTVDASLDLHGFVIAEAEEEVREFLNSAKLKNYKSVRIITGKGINSPDGQGRLKPWLEDYLSHRHYSFQSAKISEGGEGAVVVTFK